ncbi:MAG: bifunctional (p)ppGpp synthetase/guanosine-3',5'-bis(diphosphate) 3'-pyrophosphohydrolase [Bacilli bacterium]|nr:bifunctional (p)ppGpp synthetase/guanosine-3',5'-bis(diphosphate) 3'-pyrophosphohydrolase [Bacilli bacterium]
MNNYVTISTIDELINAISKYNNNVEDLMLIRKAYELAENLHSTQYRQSGEPYIIHPLNVAYILSEMHAARDTIIAGLLHDTLEDTNITKKELEELFGYDVANLVDGVTKISKMHFQTKEEMNIANTRKIINGFINDVRIIIVKLADRLHNMRTLQYKKVNKQQENALETLEIFAPMAYFIGAYKVKGELEDLSLKYLKPDEYKMVEEIRNKAVERHSDALNEMTQNISDLLTKNYVYNEVFMRVKNIYGIYKRLSEGAKIPDIHDLLALKIMVDEVMACYMALGYVHSIYHPTNDLFKDYICNPKINKYQSLHSTIIGPDGRLVQAQIRTFDMNLYDTYGLSAYWYINNGDTRKNMQEEFKKDYALYDSLKEMNSIYFKDNDAFVRQVKGELFNDKIFVYTINGDMIDLPNGSTPIDFAYKLHTELGNTMVSAIVNDLKVPLNAKLENGDRVKIITSNLADGPQVEWLNMINTTHAKKKIKEYLRKK